MRTEFFVSGLPQPQGSTRAFIRGGRAVTTSANPKNRDWRTVVGFVAQEHVQQFEESSPVSLEMEFVMPRPQALPKTRVTPMTKKPDLDKLERSICDALTGIAYRDDSQVTHVRKWKRYAAIGEQSGVRIVIDIPV